MSVQHIILDTIEDKVKRMSLQACNDPKGLKLVLSLIILNDLLQWAEDNSERDIQLIQHKIDTLLQNCSACFDMKRADRLDRYRNVNLPQDTYTWQLPYNPDAIVVQDGKTYVKITNLIEF